MLRSKLSYLLLAVALLAGGCASGPVNHEVTVFHNWPAGMQARTFRFAEPGKEQDPLVYQTWQGLIRTELERAGFSPLEASGADNPALIVSFDYQVKSRELAYRRTFYMAPSVYLGHYSRHGGVSIAAPFWWYGYPETIDQTVEVFDHSLTLTLSDFRSGSAVRVFEGSGVRRSRSRQPAQALPMLVQAVLTDFPGPSGVVRRVGINPPPKAR